MCRTIYADNFRNTTLRLKPPKLFSLAAAENQHTPGGRLKRTRHLDYRVHSLVVEVQRLLSLFFQSVMTYICLLPSVC